MTVVVRYSYCYHRRYTSHLYNLLWFRLLLKSLSLRFSTIILHPHPTVCAYFPFVLLIYGFLCWVTTLPHIRCWCDAASSMFVWYSIVSLLCLHFGTIRSRWEGRIRAIFSATWWYSQLAVIVTFLRRLGRMSYIEILPSLKLPDLSLYLSAVNESFYLCRSRGMQVSSSFLVPGVYSL